MSVAIVTGASAGIGAAIARALSVEGFDLALGARGLDRLEALASELREAGGRAQAFALDVSDSASIYAFYASVGEALGPVDVLVNNAGVCRPGLFAEGDDADLEYEVATNFLGPARLSRRVVRELRARNAPGDVVFISSENAVHPRTYQLGYTATKMGLEGLASVLRMELEGSGIRSTVVRPGPTESEFGFGWDPVLLEEILVSWSHWGVQRHMDILPPSSVARAVVQVVTAPRGTHYDLVSVMPERSADS